MAGQLGEAGPAGSGQDGPGQPRPKRRRLLRSTEVPAVPVYSGKVNSSFQLCPAELRRAVPTLQWQGDVDEVGPDTPPRPERPHAPRLPQDPCADWLEEAPQLGAARTVRDKSPSPPPPPRPTRLQRGRTRLQLVVEHMARRLQVRPGQILLLLRDVELAPGSTPQTLGLGVADIIDCVVDVAAGEPGARPGPGELRLTVRGQEKDSQLTLTVPRAEPLHGLMERYQQAMGLGGRQLRFFFDGQRLAGTRTPEQLGMEPDDVIEAWA